MGCCCFLVWLWGWRTWPIVSFYLEVSGLLLFSCLVMGMEVMAHRKYLFRGERVVVVFLFGYGDGGHGPS